MISTIFVHTQQVCMYVLKKIETKNNLYKLLNLQLKVLLKYTAYMYYHHVVLSCDCSYNTHTHENNLAVFKSSRFRILALFRGAFRTKFQLLNRPFTNLCTSDMT